MDAYSLDLIYAPVVIEYPDKKQRKGEKAYFDLQ